MAGGANGLPWRGPGEAVMSRRGCLHSQASGKSPEFGLHKQHLCLWLRGDEVIFTLAFFFFKAFNVFSFFFMCVHV